MSLQPVKGKKKKASSASKTPVGVRSFAERYYNARNQSYHFEQQNLMDELRRYILDHDLFALEIASLLVELCDACPEDNERINAALQVLSDMLEILRIELERQRPGSAESMERLQRTLAQKIFVEYGEADLCAAVSHTLLQSRVELLPVLHDANSQRMLLNTTNIGLHGVPEEHFMDGLFKSVDEMGVNSPFEALENLLRLLALGPAEMQVALCAEMLGAESLLVRDTATLMFLHPSPEVRLGVSELLATVGKNMTPDSLRRLIVARNWFPETIRKNIDQAVSNARKARVECAPLPKNTKNTVYASPVDGAFAQSFQVIVPAGKGFICCSILLKHGVGVADAFVVSLPAKQDLENFQAIMIDEGAFIESSMAYLDNRVCHALAEGAALGKAPNFWLLHVAETLGKDQWKAIPFQPQRELENLRAALSSGSPGFLTDKSRKKALKESANWCEDYAFTSSWFEDDVKVDRLVEGVLKKKRKGADGEYAAVYALIDNILEERRSIWLGRLILCAMWLKSSSEAPLPWYQMFYLAEAVNDKSIPLTGIPLMETIAVQTLGAYLARSEEDSR